MINISAETYEKNGVKLIIDSNGTLWLNEKHIEKIIHKKNI